MKLPKNANKAVLLESDGSPSCPRMNILDNVLAPGLSTPAIIYTPSAYEAGVFLVSRLPVKHKILSLKLI